MRYDIDFQAEAEKRQPLIVDHLAFTFPIRDLRHLPKYSSRYPFHLPVHPIQNPALSSHEFNQRMRSYEMDVYNTFEALFENFIYHDFGMTLSPPRGRGLHGYADSFILLDKNGQHELGLVGFGGNNDTIFVQLSGLGCKYLFAMTTPQKVHRALTVGLGITTLARIDLAMDDFNGNFGIDYASTAFFDGAFRTSSRGNYPKMKPFVEYDGSGKENITGLTVGSRQSRIFWRVYDKKQEQKIKDDSIVWIRTEVELKKCTVDVLFSPAAFFAGLCDFSASMEVSDGLSLARKAKKTVLDIKAKTAWARQQVGKTLAELYSFYDGDLSQLFGLLIPQKHRDREIDLPDTDLHLLKQYLGVKVCPF